MVEPAATSVDADVKEVLEDAMNNVYAKQYFDTTSREFANEFFNVSLDQFLSLIPSLQKSILAAQMKERSGKEAETISSEIAKFTVGLYSRLEKNVDKFELYLDRHILQVPPSKLLEQDEVQLRYKELIKDLEKEIELVGTTSDESTVVDALSKKLDEDRVTLLRKKLDKVKLQFEIEQMNLRLHRLEVFEKTVNSVFSKFDGSLKEFILKNVAAVESLPKLGEFFS